MESTYFRPRHLASLLNKGTVVCLLAIFLASVAAKDAMSQSAVPSSGDDMTGDMLLLRGTMGGFDLLRNDNSDKSTPLTMAVFTAWATTSCASRKAKPFLTM